MPVPDSLPPQPNVRPSFQPTIDSDRLYGVSYRPQELALYGDQVRFNLRCAPVFDDPAEISDTHFRLMVLEITTQIPADLATGQAAHELQLLKIGWELTLRVSPAQRVGTLTEGVGEAARLLDRIADAVNDLARRAGLEAPLGPEVVTHLLTTYRLDGVGTTR